MTPPSPPASHVEQVLAAHWDAWHRRYGAGAAYAAPGPDVYAAARNVARAVWQTAEAKASGGDVDATAASMLRTLFANYLRDDGRRGFDLEAMGHPLRFALTGITGYLATWRRTPTATAAPASASPPPPATSREEVSAIGKHAEELLKHINALAPGECRPRFQPRPGPHPTS